MPELAQYQDCWPARSYLHVHLVNRLQTGRAKSRAQSRREEDEEEDEGEEDTPEPQPTAATASTDVPSPVGIYYSVVRETDD